MKCEYCLTELHGAYVCVNCSRDKRFWRRNVAVVVPMVAALIAGASAVIAWNKSDEAQEALKQAEVRTRHEAELLRYPNVVGVDEGIRTKDGVPTGERCLVVYVERKVPRDQLAEAEILPGEIEGVSVDVVETGEITPLPM